MRSYGKETETIWDAKEGCQHEWQTIQQSARGGSGENANVGANKNTEANNRGHPTISNTCSLCGAWKGQLGLEPNINLYLDHILQITAELKRVLKPSGTMWWNCADTYSGSGGAGGDYNKDGIREGQPKYKQGSTDIPTKSRMMIPERFAMRMIDEQGFILRNDIAWTKNNGMPSSATDRLSTHWEHIYFFTKNKKYFFDLDSIREARRYPSQHVKDICEEIFKKAKDMRGQVKFLSYEGKVKTENAEMLSSPRARQLRSSTGSMQELSVAVRQIARDYIKEHLELTKAEIDYINNFQHNAAGNIIGSNPSDVWEINTEALREEHFAAFPTELPRRAMIAGCPKEVCSKCGKPKKPILEPSVYSEEGKADMKMNNDLPYAIIEREGTIAFRKLPPLMEMKEYLNTARKAAGFTIDQVEEKLQSQAPHHWFNGESYPEKEDWLLIKALLMLDDTYDMAFTKEYFKPAEKLASPKQLMGYAPDCNCHEPFVSGTVLDPFTGSGTTLMVAKQLGYEGVGFEINPSYIEIIERRCKIKEGIALGQLEYHLIKPSRAVEAEPISDITYLS